MVTWKAISLDVLILAVTCVIVAVILRPWLERREQKRWPTVTGTVTAYKQGPGPKAYQRTYLQGHYLYGGETRTFCLAWDTSTYGDRDWVPPAGVPPLGAAIVLRVNPNHPAVAVLDESPLKPSTLGTFAWITFLVLLFSAFGIAIWFM